LKKKIYPNYSMLAILALCASISLAGCGLEDDDDDDDDNGGGNTIVNVTESCDLTSTLSTCTEYTGTYWNSVNITASCTEGTVGITCPTSGFVGKCLVDSGTSTEHITFYFPEYTAAVAETICTGTEGGTFTAAP